MRFTTSYLDKVYTSPDKYAALVKEASKTVKRLQKKLNFDAIAFRGTSGAAMAYPISVATGIPLICVRKVKERSHGRPVEGSHKFEVKSYLIVDDFIESGNTIDKIIDAINHEIPWFEGADVPCVGILLYAIYRKRKAYNNIPIFSVTIPKKKKR